MEPLMQELFQVFIPSVSGQRHVKLDVRVTAFNYGMAIAALSASVRSRKKTAPLFSGAAVFMPLNYWFS